MHYHLRPPILGRLNSWVVSHLALIFGTLCHALGCEFKPRWLTTNSFLDPSTTSTLYTYLVCLIHTIICLSILSCELWNRKLKIKEIYFKNITSHHRATPKNSHSLSLSLSLPPSYITYTGRSLRVSCRYALKKKISKYVKFWLSYQFCRGLDKILTLALWLLLMTIVKMEQLSTE